MLKNVIKKYSDGIYIIFRILIGFLFFLHGIQKLPGILSGKTAAFGLFWFAGIIELVGSVFIILGLLTIYTALISGIEMLVAFFYAHVGPNGVWHPLVNKGEPALLFFAAFLVLFVYGAGKLSIDGVISKK